MKYNRFILPLAACAFLFAGCVDEVMEWQEPDGTITEDDIPLYDSEALANYKTIKEYAAEYLPGMKIGLGLGADLYIEDPAYKGLADANFQMFTTGNAMKHSSVVKANGELNFATIDAFMAAVPSDIEVYGHNFLWHTQQKQQYLKSLIAPEMKVEVPQGEKCENIVTNGGFENGTNGWTGLWGKYTYAVEQPGHDSDNAIHFTISPECANQWDAQLFWELGGVYLEAGVTYYYEFYVKSDSGLACQFAGNNTSNSGGIFKDTFAPGTDWTFCSGEFTYSEGDKPEIDKVGFQFGGEPGSQIWFDDFKFGKKLEGSDEVEQDPMINIIGEAGTFESGDVSAFGCWGNNSPTKEISAENEGHDSKYSMKLMNQEDGGEYQEWKAQAAYDLVDPLSSEKTYVVSFWAKSDVPGTVQFQFQNATTTKSQGGYARFNTSSDWLYCEHEFQTINGEEVYEDVNRLLINFGAYAATYYIDDFKFGEKNPEYGNDAPAESMINVVTNSGFDANTDGWISWNNHTKEIVTPGYEGDGALKLTVNSSSANNYSDQMFWTLADPLKAGVTYVYEYTAKTETPGTNVQFMYQSEDGEQQNWLETNELPSDWFTYTGEFTIKEDHDNIKRIGIQFGGMEAVLYIDNFKFGEKIASPAALKQAPVKLAAPTITYIYKTAEEKKALLLGAMESWIKQMAEHLPTVKYWDVINEPIADGSHEWRGINNVFNGTDTAPVENNGLTLNWESDHWYWGYYLGKEYAVKAFEYARKYCPSGSKLFVNDYGLESSPKKLEALIGFVKYIEDNGQTVDGIGTQMHVQAGIKKAQVDTMFKVMAATGKLVRVTELDVAVGTANPTAEQLLSQAETYKMIFESYKENIPEAQQSGITIWTLSDNADEHEFWLNGDAPNLFDGNYQRKLAYKYVCDAIAGKDLSEDFKGSDWKNLVEKEETEEETEEGTEEGAEETPAE